MKIKMRKELKNRDFYLKGRLDGYIEAFKDFEEEEKDSIVEADSRHFNMGYKEGFKKGTENANSWKNKSND